MGGPFIPDPSRPHLRYPADFIREAERVEQARAAYRIAHALGKWNMTMPRARDMTTAHTHLVEHCRLAKQDAIDRLQRGDRDWDGLRRAINRYVEFQNAADVVSGQTSLDRP